MAIKPILFNTEMVRAILDGRKSCTRRLVKNDVEAVLNSPYHKAHPEVEDKQIISKLCNPPYQLGDILYVRETWERFECWNCEGDESGNCPKEPKKSVLDKTCGCYMYRATDEINGDAKWHPSIHMPKEAARIWLKVTSVRVERLQEITEDGCIAEGIYPSNCRGCNATFGCDTCPHEGYDEVDEFADLWNSTIKKSDLDRYGWDANPWVWVIEFERCEKPAESPYSWNDAIHKLTKGV